MTRYTSDELMKMEHEYGAHNYHPLEVVISKAEGIWVEDPEGRRYMDMLSAYSAVNQGHRHPKIIKALKDQADILTLTSRAFFNDKWPIFAKKLSGLTGKEMILPMNTGAEAVETAIKTMRKWGYMVKGVEKDKAEIIVFADNFHGRTVTIISFSVDPDAKENYGPFTPGFVVVPYDNLEAVEKAVNKNTVGILVEPIQEKPAWSCRPKDSSRDLNPSPGKTTCSLRLTRFRRGSAARAKPLPSNTKESRRTSSLWARLSAAG